MGPRFIAAKQSTRAALEERRECLEIFAKGALKVAERKVVERKVVERKVVERKVVERKVVERKQGERAHGD